LALQRIADSLEKRGNPAPDSPVSHPREFPITPSFASLPIPLSKRLLNWLQKQMEIARVGQNHDTIVSQIWPMWWSAKTKDLNRFPNELRFRVDIRVY
jgi:hypothetical protein